MVHNGHASSSACPRDLGARLTCALHVSRTILIFKRKLLTISSNTLSIFLSSGREDCGLSSFSSACRRTRSRKREWDIELIGNYVHVSGIDLPQPGGKPSARVQEVGRRLAGFAKLWGVSFEFHALADKWETITPAQLCLKHDEVLAVNCQYRLRNLLDESIMAASPRKVVLDRIRSMNPKVRILSESIRFVCRGSKTVC